MNLLEFVLNSDYFVVDGTFYKQIFGCTVGSPVSAILANLVMEHVEERALNTAPHPPKLWCRYVDGSHVCIARERLSEFHSHLNSINAHIRFTVEEEKRRIHRISGHQDNQEPRWNNKNQCLQESHTHWQIPPIQLSPPFSTQTLSGENPSRQSKEPNFIWVGFQIDNMIRSKQKYFYLKKWAELWNSSFNELILFDELSW